MNQIKLKNGQTYNTSSNSSESNLVINLASIDELTDTYKSFTDDNLSEYTILNDSGLVCAIYINKK